MYCPHKQPAILLNLSQRDQQPWPGQTPRRWIRAWLSRWMKGCSQLTLQKRNRTTLSWQQTAGHRVSLISNGKCFTEKAMNTIILKNKCWPSLSSECGGGRNNDILSSLFMLHSCQVWCEISYVSGPKQEQQKHLCHQTYPQGLDVPTYCVQMMLKMLHSYILVLWYYAIPAARVYLTYKWAAHSAGSPHFFEKLPVNIRIQCAC